eukprot:1136828-Pelagomonas_calceolata.AAC.3
MQTLMGLGINGIHKLTSPCKTHIITVAQLQAKYSKVDVKCKIALNRLAALVDLSPGEDLSTPSIQVIIAYKSTETNTLAQNRLINKTHVSGLNVELDTPTHTYPLAGFQPNSTPPTQVVPSPQPCSASHYTDILDAASDVTKPPCPLLQSTFLHKKHALLLRK